MKKTEDLIKMSFENPILLIDGVCVFCNKSLQFILKRDKEKVFRYAYLQSFEWQNLTDSKSSNIDTVILLDKGEAYTKSDVTIQVAKNLSGPVAILRFLWIIPRFIRNWFYDIIAKYRYKIFGKEEVCIIPTPDQKSLFID